MKKAISIFASGLSILDLTKEDLNYIQDKSIIVNTNFPLTLHIADFSPDILIWCDYLTTKFNHLWYSKSKKESIFISRREAFTLEMTKWDLHKKVDIWFNDKQLNLMGKLTFLWAIQLFKKWYSDFTFLLFGLDGYIPKILNDQGKECLKWYDKYILEDIKQRDNNKYKKDLDIYVDWVYNFFNENEMNRKRVYNCNMNSKVSYLPKVDYRDIL